MLGGHLSGGQMSQHRLSPPHCVKCLPPFLCVEKFVPHPVCVKCLPLCLDEKYLSLFLRIKCLILPLCLCTGNVCPKGTNKKVKHTNRQMMDTQTNTRTDTSMDTWTDTRTDTRTYRFTNTDKQADISCGIDFLVSYKQVLPHSGPPPKISKI